MVPGICGEAAFHEDLVGGRNHLWSGSYLRARVQDGPKDGKNLVSKLALPKTITSFFLIRKSMEHLYHENLMLCCVFRVSDLLSTSATVANFYFASLWEASVAAVGTN